MQAGGELYEVSLVEEVSSTIADVRMLSFLRWLESQQLLIQKNLDEVVLPLALSSLVVALGVCFRELLIPLCNIPYS